MGIDDMSMAELRDLAKRRKIDAKGIRKKADLIQAIRDAEQGDDAVEVKAEVIEADGRSNDLVTTCNPGTLTANFDVLEAHVDAILSKYDGWNPSSDNANDLEAIKIEKKDLKALYDQIEERRKAVKREYLKPLDAFDARAMGISRKVKGVRDRLMDVEKEAEEFQKSQKKQELRDHYEAYAGLLLDVVPYDRLHDDRWLNKTCNIQTAKAELEGKIDAIARDYETLKSLDLEFADEAKTHYFDNLNLGEAIAWAGKLADDKLRIKEMEAQLEPEPPVEDAAPDYEAEPYPDYEPFDPMTMEPEHVPYRAPQPVPVAAPIPAQAPIPAPVPAPAPDAVEILAAQLIDAAGGDAKKAVGAVMARMEVQKPANDALRPRVMVIDAATVEQIRRIGQCCGAIGITGRFSSGTLQEVYDKECALAAQRYQGQVMQYGA